MFSVPSSMAEKYKLLQRSNVSEQYPFTWKVFSGWDHAITHSETARLKATHLANSLRVRGRYSEYVCVYTTHACLAEVSTVPSTCTPTHIRTSMETQTHTHHTHTHNYQWARAPAFARGNIATVVFVQNAKSFSHKGLRQLNTEDYREREACLNSCGMVT